MRVVGFRGLGSEVERSKMTLPTARSGTSATVRV